ncbi:hypothetical protein CN689_22385 [Peribacillus butanolivorans]|uniref:Uncharacterized protein n=1 Tax=Peribacillus butanolivorans TaxID=421767 RepID=A0AAX0RWB6_9BACI|nr:hypothetical protein [Peribacillus butanolivorans]PEJ28306.1 hypothetical protein CN689_22385 [Peribacillus butanolivorans]
MTLSQKLIRKWLLPFVLCFALILVFLPQNKAEAATMSGDVLYKYGMASKSFVTYRSPVTLNTACENPASSNQYQIVYLQYYQNGYWYNADSTHMDCGGWREDWLDLHPNQFKLGKTHRIWFSNPRPGTSARVSYFLYY